MKIRRESFRLWGALSLIWLLLAPLSGCVPDEVVNQGDPILYLLIEALIIILLVLGVVIAIALFVIREDKNKK